MMNKRFVLLICASIFLLSTLLSVYTITSASGTEEIIEPEYIEIADYYDNRTAVVTVTADDWIGGTTAYFEDMSRMLTAKNIYFTGGIETSYHPNWTQIQYWLNQGYLEVASHSRTHPRPPYDDPDSEINGSKQDIIDNLVMPAHFSFGANEYVYSWIEPWGDSDDTVRQELGENKYLADREVNIDDEWATWDSVNGLFDPIGFSMRMESGYETDVSILNEKFNDVYSASGIYHLMFHPRDANWTPGEYADLHTSYISNRNDVWYVNFGLLYLYHWIDTRNVTQVTPIGSSRDKVFKINITSTDRQNYGAKYPVTYVFDIPQSWTNETNPYVNYRFRETDSWMIMENKTSSDFFNGIDAVRFDFSNHKAYVSIGFDDASNEIFLQILPQYSQPVADFSATPTSGLAPLPVNFTDLSVSYDGITSWTWNFGDGETSSKQNPIHIYNQNGVYTVKLKVYESDGDNDTKTKVDYVIIPNQPPIADANGSYTGTEGIAVTFDGSGSYDSDGTIISYFWDFGDGKTSTEQDPTHTYTQNGTYTVTLTVTDDGSAIDTDTTNATVDDIGSTADFSAMPTSGDEPLAVSFTDLSVSYDGITSWNWSFGDGETSTEQNPTHTYASAGLYTVSLKVSEEDGNNDTKTKFPYIIVDDNMPNANFTYSPSNPLEGDQVTFDASSSTGYDEPLSYSWDFGDDAFGEGVSPAHAYAQDGNYLVTLTVTDADESTDSISQTITVADTALVVNFSANATSGPEPLTVSFTDLSTSYDGITSWTWNFEDGETSTEQNPTHMYAADGTYTVSLTVIEADGNNDIETKASYITVTDSTPLADFSCLPNPAALTIDFTDQSTSYDELVSWAWNFSDGETSTEQNPIHKFPNNGTFNVMLTVTDADGSTDTITRQVLTYLPNSPFESPFPLFVVLVIAIIGFTISLGILFMRKL